MGIGKFPSSKGKFPTIPRPSQIPSSKCTNRRIGFNMKNIFLIVIFGIILQSCEKVSGQNDIEDFLNNEIVDNFGLTAYGEPCTDECSKRGFSYAWCHKTPSRNGTWVDRDYCRLVYIWTPINKNAWRLNIHSMRRFLNSALSVLFYDIFTTFGKVVII